MPRARSVLGSSTHDSKMLTRFGPRKALFVARARRFTLRGQLTKLDNVRRLDSALRRLDSALHEG
jgi:hypothetical protein